MRTEIKHPPCGGCGMRGRVGHNGKFLEGEDRMRKRFGLRALAGLTTVAAVAVVALMVAGSGGRGR